MLDQFIIRTPLIALKDESGIFVKPENLQVFGSYKIRGIANAIKLAPPEKLKNGLVTVSAGNMAQSVAFAAKELNIPCKIYIPESAPEVKKISIKKLGAHIIELPFSDIWDMVRSDDSDKYPELLIHPVFTNGLTYGYGMIAQEILEDLPNIDAIVIPFGVGGLTLGISRILKKINPSVHIYVSEPTTASPFKASIENKKAMRIERISSFIDAIGTPEVLPYVYHELKDVITDSIVITPEEALSNLKDMALNNKLICEGAAAVSVAAAKKLAQGGRYKNIVSVLSGGNIASDVLLKALSS